MKILMLGNYDINNYSRGRILYEGLKENNIFTNIYLPKKNRYLRLAKRILKKDFDKLLVTGKFVLALSWILKPFHRKKIIFDVFISDYENLVVDRKVINPKSIKAKFLYLGDKIACKLADYNILDTKEHIEYFHKKFNLKKSKFSQIYIGSDSKIFKPQNKTSKIFTVEFHGTFIPLQGIEYIIKAAKILEKESIQFRILGTGQEHKKIIKLKEDLNLKNIYFSNKNVSLKELSEEINSGDVCLGIFGKSIKTQNVIPNKAFEIVACKKPLITSETPAIKELFKDKENCILCEAANEKDLAEKILLLKNNPKLKKNISENSYELFTNKLNKNKIVLPLIKIINQ
jgi:glycosyltransferase involved in cell wall biosynthesis